MSLFDFFKKKKSAQKAKDRLSVAIALDRDSNIYPHLDQMKQEIMEVVKKYSQIKDVSITKDKVGDKDILDIEIVLEEGR
ncbi:MULTISPECIES: cell division topological specificity factor MinE [unclassified Nitratiruptor]|uniref:cell division topological specificity factor MinE n=1 Tax=unclassified Nitratiruptor TaxID=2624044 RepID=UPI00191576E6|nr:MULTISPECIES: cell division topological specificity factor MinE [unclassified Nitratiruptor]BCD60456.1 cell division topological specificity factor [Nitratiruptor sp. YY08-10]BCD64055.1 cell division topological specificity factor [Nitratiruptor sp. YY08-14]